MTSWDVAFKMTDHTGHTFYKVVTVFDADINEAMEAVTGVVQDYVNNGDLVISVEIKRQKGAGEGE